MNPKIKSKVKQKFNSISQLEFDKYWYQAVKTAEEMGKTDSLPFIIGTMQELSGLSEDSIYENINDRFIESDKLSYEEYLEEELLSTGPIETSVDIPSELVPEKKSKQVDK